MSALGRFTFTILLHPFSTPIPIHLDFLTHPKTPLPIHLQVHRTRIAAIPPSEQEETPVPEVEVRLHEPVQLFHGGEALRLGGGYGRYLRWMEWLVRWACVPLLVAAVMMTGNKECDFGSGNGVEHGYGYGYGYIGHTIPPNTILDYYTDLITQTPTHALPIFNETSTILGQIGLSSRRMLLNPSLNISALSPFFNAPSFFSSLSAVLLEVGSLHKDVYTHTLSVWEKSTHTSLVRRELDLVMGAFDNVNHARVPAICAQLLDTWYDLASSLPASLATLESKLQALETRISKAKDPAEAISALQTFIVSEDASAWTLTALPHSLTTGIRPLRRSLTLLSQALELPLKALEILDLNDPQLGLSRPATSQTRRVRQVLQELAKLDAEMVLSQLDQTFADAETLASMATMGHRSVNALSAAMDGKEVGFVTDGVCDSEFCLLPLEEVVASVKRVRGKVENVKKEQERYWRRWKRVMEGENRWVGWWGKEVEGGGKLVKFADPAFP